MNDTVPYYLPFLIIGLRYLILAGIPFLIFYILFPEFYKKNKIQERLAQKKDFVREILHSVQTVFIIAVVGVVMFRTPLKAYTQTYDHLSDHSIWWLFISTFLALVVHDAYFYLIHKMAHHPKLHKHIHMLHHKSINPSPWASYSFEFAEGLSQALIAPIVLILIPMHPIALVLFAFAGFIFNVYGHLGYEIAPKWFRHSFLFEIINTSTHHNLHHSKFKGNYGLYFRFWDRFLGTEHPDYVKEYDKIQERRFGKEGQLDYSLKR